MNGVAQALHAFVQLFDEMGIPYVVMGGIAVRVYGIPRPTHDVDHVPRSGDVSPR